MNKLISIVIMLSVLPLISCAQEMTYEMFLDNHIEARGGREAIENVFSVTTEIEIQEGERKMVGFFRANRDGQMRIDVFVEGERVFTEALTSINEGWQLDGGETVPKTLSDQGMANLQKAVHTNVYGLHEMEGLGYQIKFLGLKNFRDNMHWAIDLISPNGQSERLFYDQKKFLKVGSMDESALHVDVDPTKTLNASMTKNHMMVDGVMFSFGDEVINLRTNSIIQTSNVIKIEVNKAQNPDQFLTP